MNYDLTKMPEIAAAMSSFERECAITVALKISDESCKMEDYEKSVFMLLYDSLPHQSTDFFEPDVFEIIHKGRTAPTAKLYAAIKQRREAGMEFIGRPKMKAFKAEIRRRLSA